VTSTGQIGLVRIVGEESVSAGTRRITAVTGARALDRFRQAEQTLAESASTLKVPVGELAHRLTAVVKELRDLKKAKPAAAGASLSVDELLAAASDVGGTRIVVADAKGGDAGAMRQCIDLLRRKASPIAVFLGSVEGDKVTLVAGISRELEERGLSAGMWIKDAATVVGGKGGGRPDLAQAGGKLVDQLPAALAAARKSIESLLRA
jgi:alanyl-tRNA synthetase